MLVNVYTLKTNISGKIYFKIEKNLKINNSIN